MKFLVTLRSPEIFGCIVATLTLLHMGGGADSALFQIVFFITSVRDAAEPRNLVTFPKI